MSGYAKSVILAKAQKYLGISTMSSRNPGEDLSFQAKGELQYQPSRKNLFHTAHQRVILSGVTELTSCQWKRNLLQSFPFQVEQKTDIATNHTWSCSYIFIWFALKIAGYLRGRAGQNVFSNTFSKWKMPFSNYNTYWLWQNYCVERFLMPQVRERETKAWSAITTDCWLACSTLLQAYKALLSSEPLFETHSSHSHLLPSY